MLVFCGGMIRAASTLQYQLASSIVELRDAGERVTWHEPDDLSALLPFYTAKDGYFVFKTHNLTHPIRELFQKSMALGIYIYRDIRDVVVSLMRKNKRSFEEVFPATVISALDQFTQWTSQPQVMSSRYENVLGSIASEVQRIADHLKLSVSIEEVKHLANEHSLECQKRRIQRSQANPDKLAGAGTNTYDARSLLHLNHITSGNVGEWKEALMQDQVGMIESVAGEWLEKQGYK